MSNKEDKKNIEDDPLFKGRSQKSREKIADQCMTISSNLWSIVFVSLITIPLGLVINSTLSEKPIKPLFQVFKANIDTYFGFLLFLVFLAIGLAFWFRKYALDTYDKLQKPTNKSK